MARRSNSTNEVKKLVRCRDCFWANLMQYGTDPIIAECRQKPNYYNEKFPYERDVANAMRLCPKYQHQDQSEKSIQQCVYVRHYPKAAWVRSQEPKGVESVA